MENDIPYCVLTNSALTVEKTCCADPLQSQLFSLFRPGITIDAEISERSGKALSTGIHSPTA